MDVYYCSDDAKGYLLFLLIKTFSRPVIIIIELPSGDISPL